MRESNSLIGRLWGFIGAGFARLELDLLNLDMPDLDLDVPELELDLLGLDLHICSFFVPE